MLPDATSSKKYYNTASSSSQKETTLNLSSLNCRFLQLKALNMHGATAWQR